MKILMSTDTLGGVWTYALDLAAALEPHGCQIALATMGRPLTDDQWSEIENRPNVEVFESNYRLEWMQDPWEEVDQAGDWLLSLARRVEPDLVHLNHFAHGGLDWQAPVLMVGHSCVFSWFEAVHGAAPGEEWEEYRQRVRQGLHAANLVVAPTQAMLEALQRHYGPLGPRRAILNGRDRALFKTGRKQATILAAGRLWDEAKNLATLARVAPQLDWPVRLAGEARHPDGGENELPGVEHVGRLPAREMAGEYAQAAIYALPARYEPFGLSALEAALSGCALVLGDIPSLREVWGDAAWFVPPDDEAKLVKAINQLVGHWVLREQYVRRARRRAQKLTAERMGKNYFAAYQDVLSSSPVPVAPQVQEFA